MTTFINFEALWKYKKDKSKMKVEVKQQHIVLKISFKIFWFNVIITLCVAHPVNRREKNYNNMKTST